MTSPPVEAGSAENPVTASSSSFPHDPADFDADSRISFDRANEKFILETLDESTQQPLEYEFDDRLRRWIPMVDDSLIEQQRAAYAVAGVDESQPVPQANKKRKKAEVIEEEVGGRLQKAPKASKAPGERKNTAVYITNLPTDPDEPITADEIATVFSRCGVIAEEIDTRKPRIKLYTDDEGKFKGDALVMYFRAESVALAVQLLDDTQFRFGRGDRMKVAAADFSYKQHKEVPAGTGPNRASNNRDKQKIIKKTQRLNSKLADWDDDDPSSMPETSSRWDKVVILKRMFTLQELEEDPASLLDIKSDIRDECEKMGAVTNVVLFDQETDGVASVRFSDTTAAQACVRAMNGRHFDGRVVQAYIADGMEKFRKSGEKKHMVDVNGDGDGDGDDDRFGLDGAKNGHDGLKGDQYHGVQKDDSDRLDQFGKWLEGDDQNN